PHWPSPPTTSTWSILSAVNTVNLVNTVNAVKYTPPPGGVHQVTKRGSPLQHHEKPSCIA
ncbi:MAG: hypothetical protein ACKO9Q_09575, partial [Pirellula sp.]